MGLELGALADEYPEEGQPPQFKGSAVVVRAANKAEVIEFLKQDIFYTEGVWDVDNAQINAVSFLLINNKKKKKKSKIN